LSYLSKQEKKRKKSHELSPASAWSIFHSTAMDTAAKKEEKDLLLKNMASWTLTRAEIRYRIPRARKGGSATACGE